MVDYVEEYKKLEKSYSAFAFKLKDLLHDIASNKNIAVHTVEARAKSVDSFAKKISRADKSYLNPLEEVTDLCGLRVILYYQSDVDLFCNFIRDEFSVDDERSVNKLHELSADRFGYISTHLIVNLKKSRGSLIEWSSFKSFNAEIQVRTVLQHAWASISHTLQYKNSSDTDTQIARQLNRVSGLLEVADEQFVAIKTKIISLRDQVERDFSKNNLDIDVDSVSLDFFIENFDYFSKIRDSVVKNGFYVRVDDCYNDFYGLVDVCSDLEIEKIQELKDILESFSEYTEQFFKNFAKKRTSPSGVSARVSGSIDHWVSVILIAYNFKMGSVVDFYFGWSKDYVDDISRSVEELK